MSGALLYSTDYTGSNGAAWPTGWTAGKTPASGGCTIQANAGQLKTGTVGGVDYASWVSIYRSTARQNVEILTKVTKPAGESTPILLLRSVDTGAGFDASDGVRVWLNASGNLVLDEAVGFTATAIGQVNGVVSNGITYWLRVLANGASITITLWDSAGSEPGSPTLTGTTSITASGQVGWVVLGGAAAASQIVSVDDWAEYDIATSVAAAGTASAASAATGTSQRGVPGSGAAAAATSAVGAIQASRVVTGSASAATAAAGMSQTSRPSSGVASAATAGTGLTLKAIPATGSGTAATAATGSTGTSAVTAAGTASAATSATAIGSASIIVVGSASAVTLALAAASKLTACTGVASAVSAASGSTSIAGATAGMGGASTMAVGISLTTRYPAGTGSAGAGGVGASYVISSHAGEALAVSHGVGASAGNATSVATAERTQIIPAELRILTIASEPRLTIIRPEARVLEVHR